MSARLGIPEPHGVVAGPKREPPDVMLKGDGVDQASLAHER